MKHLVSLLFGSMITLLTYPFGLVAQDVTGGVITYEQIIDYQLVGAYDDPLWDNYIADLPKKGKSVHQLSFTLHQALYEEDRSSKKVASEHLKTAIMKANYYKAPKPKVKQSFVDLNKKEQLEQVEFMTRSFLIKKGYAPKAWKLTTRKKKVLDYICMGAELEVGNETITAWFTPQIPIAIGPGTYHGLPGVILGLEKNDEVFLLATKVELEKPQEDLTSRLNKGRRLSQTEFDQIVEEKTREFKETRAAEKKAGSKSKN
ncbi:MAG: GLPGLI family protein [Saprospiraceae bacterium]|nr:GLPGLI family protein [Saprospiraceae bacterium]